MQPGEFTRVYIWMIAQKSWSHGGTLNHMVDKLIVINNDDQSRDYSTMIIIQPSLWLINIMLDKLVGNNDDHLLYHDDSQWFCPYHFGDKIHDDPDHFSEQMISVTSRNQKVFALWELGGSNHS